MRTPANTPLWTETAQDDISARFEAWLSVILVICLLAGATICGASFCTQSGTAVGTIAAAAPSQTPVPVQTSLL